MDENRITYFAETDYRNSRQKFGIKAKDRTRHVYVIGKTGMGKSTVLENMAIQDIQNGEGLAFLDPHGGTAEKLLEYVPEDRIKDVIYFAPFDIEYPISFNVMEDVGADKRHLVASGLMSSFKKIWADAWSARMEYILNNTILALLEYPGATLLGVNRMLADKEFRKKVVENISDPSVKSFWVDEFAKYTDRFAAEATPAIQNKVGQFTANPLIRNIIGQSKSSFDIRSAMDNKKILIVNLSKGRVGEQNANLLGAMLITKIYLGAMSRADLSSDSLATKPNFYLYVDEFQSFASDSFADILSEARKYKLNLTIAHQYVEQMSEVVRAAVFGNVGTMMVFRVGSYDAQIFEKEFAPQFIADDIVNLGQYQMYLRLMIDGVGSKPFSARGMAPIPRPEYMQVDKIIESSRNNNARPRKTVEEEILKWHEPLVDEKKAERMRKYVEENPGSPQTETHTQGTHTTASSPRVTLPPVQTPFKAQFTKIVTPARDHTAQKFERQPRREFVERPAKPAVHREVPPAYKNVSTVPHVTKPQTDSITPEIKKTSLSDILSKIDTEERVQQKIVPPPTAEKVVPPVSLTTLRSKDEKGPTPNKLSMLKNVLEKLNKDAEHKKAHPENDSHKEAAPQTESVPRIGNKTEINEKKNEEAVSSKKVVREVPEDVLKKILE
jgi:hypothetical protein